MFREYKTYVQFFMPYTLNFSIHSSGCIHQWTTLLNLIVLKKDNYSFVILSNATTMKLNSIKPSVQGVILKILLTLINKIFSIYNNIISCYHYNLYKQKISQEYKSSYFSTCLLVFIFFSKKIRYALNFMPSNMFKRSRGGDEYLSSAHHFLSLTMNHYNKLKRKNIKKDTSIILLGFFFSLVPQVD